MQKHLPVKLGNLTDHKYLQVFEALHETLEFAHQQTSYERRVVLGGVSEGIIQTFTQLLGDFLALALCLHSLHFLEDGLEHRAEQ